MISRKGGNVDLAADYQEVPVKQSIYTMLAVVAVAALPLGWLNLRIRAEGNRVADISRYAAVVAAVNQDLESIRAALAHAHVDEKKLKGSLAPTVTLITPDVLPSDMDEASRQDGSNLKINLSAIYWSPVDPIVTINDENYRVGELIQGHRIIEIRKTEVVFEDPMGEKVVKYFYDYLGSGKK